MSTYNLDAFLEPSSVVLIGASHRPGSVGCVSAANLSGFAKQKYFVNPRFARDPRRNEYPEIKALPAVPDLAIIAVAATRVPGVVRDLGALGTRAAVVLSAGFSETQAGSAGRALLAETLAAARGAGMRLVGPNCIGVLAPYAGLNAGFTQALPPPGNLAFLSQSGAVLTALVDWASAQELGFSAMVSLGEMAEVDVADWLDYLATDVRTHAILLYLESVTDARKFMSAARHAARLKPIIVLKSGRSPVAAKAAASHSGALAGGDAVFDAAFRRAGIQRVPTLMQMLEAAETLSHGQAIDSDALAIVTNGGGLGVLAADQLIARGGRLTPLASATAAALDAALPASWSHSNPVDIIGDADAGRYRAVLDVLLDAPEVDAVAVMYCPTGLGDPLEAAQAVASAVTARPSHKPVLGAWLGPAVERVVRDTLDGAAIAGFETPEALARGFMHLVDRAQYQARLSETVPAFPLRGTEQRSEVRRLIDARLRDGVEWLDEADAKHLLVEAGFDVNESHRAATPSEAQTAAASMPAPYAVKILSPDLLHKSDVGGVALNIETPEEVARVAASMMARVQAAHAKARIAGVSVQRMVSRAHSQELIVGLTMDPVFGPVIVFGAGGITVEAVGDTALALPPLNVNLARDLVDRTRISRVLAGAKGRLPPVDMRGLIEVLIRLSELVCEFPEIADLDLNPILAAPDGVTVLDARIRLRPYQGRAGDRLVIPPYPRELERPFALPDGRRCLLRPIRPEDEGPLREAYLRLGPQSRYMRMLGTLRELPHSLAARATQIDYDREMAFVLSEDKPAGEAKLYGGVRLVSDGDRQRGEFAVTVMDDVATHGVGRQLMEVIIEYARGIGMREIYGEVLAENTPMLAICHDLGFDVKAPEAGTVVVRLPLARP